MRILWNGIGPWHRTGYGTQTAIFAPRLRDLGHQVAIAIMGKPGMNEKHPDYASPWQGIPVLAMDHSRPGRIHPEFGLPRPGAVREALGGSPDLIIVLKDAWVLTPEEYRPWPVGVWTNFDTHTFTGPDREFFTAAGAIPIATSRHGQSAMRDAGLDPLYVPHAIVSGDWGPAEDKAAARRYLGLPEAPFIVGMNAQNTSVRKAFAEQFDAFARFHVKHPSSLLLVHTNPEHPEGMNLRHLAENLGITGAVKFGAHMVMTTPQMKHWYQCLDVLMNATYGEGFGLPIVESLACGVPVIGTKGSAVTEKVPPGAGWLVSGQRLWVPPMRSWWTIPSVRELAAALGKAHRAAGQQIPAQVRTWVAAEYDADWVTRQYWKPALDALAVMTSDSD